VPDFSRDVHFSLLLDGRADQVDLPTVALEIAREEYPGLDIGAWLARLDGMGIQVRDNVRDGEDPAAIILHLNHFLFEQEGYRGNEDEYYDPKNSFLNDVIERRLGIPLTLSLMYMAVASRVGLSLCGVGMPAHFIVKFDDGDREIFIDPFHRGAVLSREACEQRVSQVLGVPVSLDSVQLGAAPCDEVVLRLLGNLKGIYVKQDDAARALRVQERIVAIRGDDLDELRDLGVLLLQNHRPARAIEVLESYRLNRPDAADNEVVESLLKAATRLRASMN